MEAQTEGCALHPASQFFCSHTPSQEGIPAGSCLNTHIHKHKNTNQADFLF